MALRITRGTMTLETGNRVVATVRSASTPRPTATVRGSSRLTLPGCSQAITALTPAGRLAIGYGDDDHPFVMAWRKELFL